MFRDFTPLIAVVGSVAPDGVYLTVWRGIPVTGTRVWRGYYAPGNPGTLPTCAGEACAGRLLRGLVA